MPVGDRSAKGQACNRAAIRFAGLPPPSKDRGMFAPGPRAGHGRRQLVISMPFMMVSLAGQPPGGMGLRYKRHCGGVSYRRRRTGHQGDRAPRRSQEP
jgi:hypothetical protein